MSGNIHPVSRVSLENFWLGARLGRNEGATASHPIPASDSGVLGMTDQKLSPRGRAHRHIVSALKAGVRGELRELLLEAERVSSVGSNSRSPSDVEYRNLKPG